MRRGVPLLVLAMLAGCALDRHGLGHFVDAAQAMDARVRVPSRDASRDAPPLVTVDAGVDAGGLDAGGDDAAPPDAGPPAVYRSCRELLDALGPLPNGTYRIQPDPAGPELEVYCDMTTDGGGWTLVVSSRLEPPDDSRLGYYDDLRTLDPVGAHRGVSDILRPIVSSSADLRFACRDDPAAAGMRVDLSFYAVGWYLEFTTGDDADSCFSEDDGAGYERPAPARRNNIDGATRPLGDDWDNDGYLEGEDYCDSCDDFTVDFDDRGMDSDQSDGTDWGDDDGSHKCGDDDLSDGVWYLFVRE